MNYKFLYQTILVIALFCNAFCTHATATPTSQQKANREGSYVGFQFGYLFSDYESDLDMYAPGRQSNAPQGSYFLFRPVLGYNFTNLLGAELGLIQFSDSAQSSTTDPIQKSSINITNVDLLALFHLPLDHSGDWVGTPKIGLSVMSASLNYQFYSPSNNPSPWDGQSNINQTSKKTILVPVAGLEFEHSYNQHWIMTFAYQYYFAKYTNFNDVYQIPVSTLGYFSTGMIYKF